MAKSDQDWLLLVTDVENHADGDGELIVEKCQDFSIPFWVMFCLGVSWEECHFGFWDPLWIPGVLTTNPVAPSRTKLWIDRLKRLVIYASHRVVEPLWTHPKASNRSQKWSFTCSSRSIRLSGENPRNLRLLLVKGERLVFTGWCSWLQARSTRRFLVQEYNTCKLDCSEISAV